MSARIERWLRVIGLRLRSILFGSRADRELDDELRFHVEQLTAEYAARGRPPSEARREALAAMNGLLQRREACRDARGVGAVEDFIYDVRYAARQCRREPGVAVVIVAVLALGVGGNTAIFSLARATLSPLAIPHPDRTVMVWTDNPSRNWHQFPASLPDVRDWQASGVFAALAPFVQAGFNLRLPDRTDRVEGLRTTGDLFAVLERRPELGRAFDAADSERVAVISHGLWRTAFNADPDAIGRSVVLDGAPHTIVGVLPADFPRFGREEIYAPLPAAIQASSRGSRNLAVVGRIADGVSLAAARQRMVDVSAALAGKYPSEDGGTTVSLQLLHDAIVQDAALLIDLLTAAVLCALAVACANVASLLLARGVGRRREFAIRSALGGGRWRLTRQLVAEHVLVATAAGIVAVVPAWAGLRFIASFDLEELPHAASAGLDATVLAFNFAVAWLAGVLCGVAPAWVAWKNDVNETLKASPTVDAGRRPQRLRKLFVVGQVALTAMLLIAGGLVMRSFLRMVSDAPGYDASHVLTMRIALSDAQYASPDRQVAYYERLVAGAAELPGVVAASAVEELPTSDNLHGVGLIIDGRPEPRIEDVPLSLRNAVLPGYFRTMAIPLVSGRWFDARDTKDAPGVAIVDEWTAKRNWPGENPIGRRLRLGRKQPLREIVGIVGDVEAPVILRFLKGRVGQIYLPFAQDPYPAMTLLMRTAADEKESIAPARTLVRRIDPDQPAFRVQTLADERAAGRRVVRLVMALLNGFAAIAVMLAAVGLSGTIAYDVRQRTREFGVRMSLGAQASDVRRSVLRDGGRLVAGGLVVGLLGAIAAIRLLSHALYGIQGNDPVALGVAIGLLAVTGLLASYVPARRATRISPIVALRTD
jgi:putative ABC transport system permease protein